MLVRYRDVEVTESGGEESTKNKDQKDALWNANTERLGAEKSFNTLFPDTTEYTDEKKKNFAFTEPCFDSSDKSFVFNKTKCVDIVAKYKKDNSLVTKEEVAADDRKCTDFSAPKGADPLSGVDACKLVEWENNLWSL
jgi:hypothetical protein